ncbi:hypothetical protein [Streptomyces massasporeus]|uniref:hypothetical protein n=1 Tax=Streptomyces massasporeus TaxID=67324 RepID=UPI0033DE910E
MAAAIELLDLESIEALNMHKLGISSTVAHIVRTLRTALLYAYSVRIEGTPYASEWEQACRRT